MHCARNRSTAQSERTAAAVNDSAKSRAVAVLGWASLLRWLGKQAFKTPFAPRAANYDREVWVITRSEIQCSK